ncbi:ABC transporter ATP-binding protein [Geomonas oryzae]|uniref:ABC transporter ATP-binding protein n=1 Tax=Geomonas oryzae TaxID=2364273 RepID=UPI00100BA39F|nr:ATP-binding cassette domain-containing protein [Geomonas oryzae]
MSEAVGKLFDLLSPGEKARLYLLFLALFLMAGIEMVGIASILPFMAVVSNPGVVHKNRWLKLSYDYFGFTSLHSYLLFLGMVVLVLMVFNNLFKAFYTWASLKYDNHLNYTLGRRLLRGYLYRPYEFFLNRNSSELGKNVLAEVRDVIIGVLSPGMQVLSSSLLCVFILVLLMVVDPMIALAITAVLGGVYGAVYLLARRRLLEIGEQQVAANTMKYKAAGEALSGIKDLKILGKEEVFLERYSDHARLHSAANVSAGVIAQLPRYALETIAFGGILLIVLSSLRSEQEVARVVPILSIYAFAGYRLLPALQTIFAGISTVRVGLPRLGVLHGDLLCGASMPASPPVAPVPPLPLRTLLKVDEAHFGYLGARETVLNGVTMEILPNTSVGIVGPTGSGKTTVVDLILGLLVPEKGRVMVDGVEIEGELVRRWQRNLGYVPQHIFLSDDSIARNIAFGVPEQEMDMEAVYRAARIANLHQFVENELPLGYDTVIGERGVRLSGGQRQRIGIARALYTNPEVLIMDEATSALDGVTEDAVMEALQTLSGTKTVILIAHRLTTVKECNVIYLMERGRIVGQGTYQELLRSSNWFKAAAGTKS